MTNQLSTDEVANPTQQLNPTANPNSTDHEEDDEARPDNPNWIDEEEDEEEPSANLNSGNYDDDDEQPSHKKRQLRTCDHLREDGTYCGSPAMRHRKYCYYHLRHRARRLLIARAAARRETWSLDLPPLDDLASVQSALTQVLQAVAANLLDPRTASVMLRGLTLAANNLKQPEEVWNQASQVMESQTRNSNCWTENYDDVEEEFGLPETLDLDTPPQVAFPPSRWYGDRVWLAQKGFPPEPARPCAAQPDLAGNTA